MAEWLEMLTSKCRGAETLNEPLKNAYMIWEDTTLNSEGKAFAVGMMGEYYFYVKWAYDTYLENNTMPEIEYITFENTESLKQWLRDMRDSNYHKSKELLAIMKYFLT